MPRKPNCKLLLLGLIAILFAIGLQQAAAKPSSSAALVGQVSSQEEGLMEGVLVSAKKEGSTITITVVSNAQGFYSFPRNRLDPGKYSLSIRAGGYEMTPAEAHIASAKSATADLKLRKVQDLSKQLTSAEWLISAPGTYEQKNALLNCVICHTVERIFRSHHGTAEWAAVQRRMATYYEGTIPERPQIKPPEPEGPPRLTPAEIEYLSWINLSSVTRWQYPLKTLPRPKGEATRMIVTQYDLPRQYAMPHDVLPGPEGMVWYSDHGQQYLGRLDPRTGGVVEYKVPVMKPEIATGLHFLEFDSDGNIWLSMGAQGGVAKFDVKSKKFQTWPLPARHDGSGNLSAYALLPWNLTVDGRVWVGERETKRIQRLDVQTGGWVQAIPNPYVDIAKDTRAAAGSHVYYDIYADSQKNVYLTDITSEYIEKIDAKTLKTTFYPTPTFDSAPRRGHMDKQDRLWFGEYQANRIGMFDSKTAKIQEWELPSPFSGPYDVFLDKNGYAWAAGMTTDRVARLNPNTGEIIEYLLPRTTNIRRVEVDDSTSPITFWTGDNHGASILKLEPRE